MTVDILSDYEQLFLLDDDVMDRHYSIMYVHK